MPRRHTRSKHTPYRGVVSSCGEKRRHKTQHEAEKAAEIAELQDINLELSVYQCPDCRSWHLTRRRSDDRLLSV